MSRVGLQYFHNFLGLGEGTNTSKLDFNYSSSHLMQIFFIIFLYNLFTTLFVVGWGRGVNKLLLSNILIILFNLEYSKLLLLS